MLISFQVKCFWTMHTKKLCFVVKLWRKIYTKVDISICIGVAKVWMENCYVTRNRILA
jgi:hypothetical protein